MMVYSLVLLTVAMEYHMVLLVFINNNNNNNIHSNNNNIHNNNNNILALTMDLLTNTKIMFMIKVSLVLVFLLLLW